MIDTRTPLFSTLAVICLLLAVACSGSSDSNVATPTAVPELAAPTAPAPPAAPPTAEPPAAAGPVEPDGARIFEHVRYLSDEIGPRPAGTPREQLAIDYITSQLSAAGYAVEVTEFRMPRQVSYEATLTVSGSAARSVAALRLGNGAFGSASGQLEFVDLGQSADAIADLTGKIALISRTDLADAGRVIEAGAAGLVVFNDQQHLFADSLLAPAAVPAVAVSRAHGEALVAAATSGSVEAELSVEEFVTDVAHNIVARPPAGDCETITGGHYDSVQPSPGANDNGSGTATVIEIAVVIAANGEMAGNCFVLFSAEELGLIGSQAYVVAMDVEARQALRAFLNFDMYGSGESNLLLLGSRDLQALGDQIAAELGITVSLSGGPGSVGSSDQAPFLAAGVPALWFNRWPDAEWHRPGDVSSRIHPEFLEDGARIGVAILQALSEGAD